jgi:hypothetical protein
MYKGDKSMSEKTKSAVRCELCGGEHPQKFSALELGSWDFNFGEEKKDFYDVCYACYDKMTESPLQTEEVQKRRKENSKNLEKTIEEGLICPKCKTFIMDENHTCPI